MSGEISATRSFLQTPSGSRYFDNLRLNHKLLNGFERPMSRQPLVFFLSSSDSALKLFCLYKSTYKKISSRHRRFQAFFSRHSRARRGCSQITKFRHGNKCPIFLSKKVIRKLNFIKLYKLEGYFFSSWKWLKLNNLRQGFCFPSGRSNRALLRSSRLLYPRIIFRPYIDRRNKSASDTFCETFQDLAQFDHLPSLLANRKPDTKI